MTDYARVYRERADAYDELVRAEDYEAHLPTLLAELDATRGARIVEVGAGTGRITRILLEAGARHVTATEREPAMLDIARRSLSSFGDRVRFEVADARSLPVDAAAADVGIAGWVFGHFRHWMPGRWRDDIGAALDELARAVRPGGRVIVIETLGTGCESPAPPNAALAEYYAWLEEKRGFERRAIRTDYRFDSVDEAARVTGAFFGPDFADRVRSEAWEVVPECTGVWTHTR